MWQLPPGITPDGIIMYLRKSRSDDPLMTVEEVLANHEQRLDAWVDRNLPGLGRVPEENRYREVVSGETIASRPDVQEVLRRIESPKVQAVLIVEPQRLSRGDLEDIGRLVKLFRYTDTLVFTERYNYDLRDDRDRSDFERELKSGNEFLEYQKRIMNAGKLLSVQNGYFIGNCPPYGYKKISYKEGKKTVYSLEPIPEEAAVVKMIFEMYAQGGSSHGIARELNRLGIKTQRGARWNPESLKSMRVNEHYLGMVFWLKCREVKVVEGGEVITKRQIQDEYMLYPGRHQAIIDRELWDKVQEIRGKIPPVKGKAKCVNPMAGLIFCSCGKPMTLRKYKRKDGTERSPDRLLCSNHEPCGGASCLATEMDQAVAGILREAIQDFELKIENNDGDAVIRHQQLIDRLEKKLEDLNAQELSQWEKYTQEGMPKHIFDQLNTKVLQEKDETKQAILEARDTMPGPVDYSNKKAMFSDALAALLSDDAPALEKNMLLKNCIERIDYSRKKKPGNNRRYGTPEPIELDVQLRV